MQTAGQLLGVLVGVILVVIFTLASSGQQISPETVQGVSTLNTINGLFFILANIILGISMIRAAVYPLWTNILLIVIGFLNVIGILAPTVTILEFIAALLIAASFCGWGITLLQQPPNYPQPPRQQQHQYFP